MLVKRLIALIIDFIGLTIVSAIVGFILQIFGFDLSVGGGIGSFVVGCAYYAYFLPKKGQSPGKSVMGIKVVSMSGGSPSAIQAILRYVGYFINTFLLFLGWFVPIFTPGNRGIQDYIAGTRVVDA